ncbi:hypothetical protein I317_02213 [Kwoniella heveanensis CBS 569]|uniref:Uncharacterized protein n=1 Tax=Kwoniella heveanensis BCC8398 TaxID=1296120 RepID=A0A1B9GJZ7_9TREE|nr:hypothetical protein I316_07084 [Kwoniella heveanensis BCC8398]OCF43943.1 hypothetical protein I317_02213 [Kwoniella heveanensis CBS 569]
MFFLYSLLAICLSLFLSVSVSAAPVPNPDPRFTETDIAPVRFITQFGSTIPPDTKVHLQWEGGSGLGYELYYIPQWPEQLEYYPVEIASGLTESHYTWRTPKSDAYPKGTTFIVGVNDAVTTLNSAWYDITGLIAFGDE